MRRPARLLAFSLVVTATAVAIGAYVHAPDARLPKRLAPAAALAPPTAARSDVTPTQLDASAIESAVAPGETAPDARATEPRQARKRARADEATVRANVRSGATEDVKIAYTLLFDDLSLSAAEREDLAAALIEMRIERTWHTYQRGRTIADQERADRIAAAIGYEKLQQFLALEQNSRAYYETYRIASVLGRHGAALTDAQRAGVFEILVKVTDWYPPTPPPVEVERNSLESVEHALEQHDEHDRHVIELAPGVLSPKQVVLLFEQYQRMSRERFASVEVTKKRATERPGELIAWGYSPGSWD